MPYPRWLTRVSSRDIVPRRLRRGDYFLLVMAGLGVGMLLSGCGGGGLSLTEYVDRLNAVNDRLNSQAEVLISDLERSTTPREVSATMERMAALRIESVQAAEAIDPPEQIADLHRLFLSWEKRLLPIVEAFALGRTPLLGGMSSSRALSWRRTEMRWSKESKAVSSFRRGLMPPPIAACSQTPRGYRVH